MSNNKQLINGSPTSITIQNNYNIKATACNIKF